MRERRFYIGFGGQDRPRWVWPLLFASRGDAEEALFAWVNGRHDRARGAPGRPRIFTTTVRAGTPVRT